MMEHYVKHCTSHRFSIAHVSYESNLAYYMHTVRRLSYRMTRHPASILTLYYTKMYPEQEQEEGNRLEHNSENARPGDRLHLFHDIPLWWLKDRAR